MSSLLISNENENDLKQSIQKRKIEMSLEVTNIQIQLSPKQQEKLDRFQEKLNEKFIKFKAKLVQQQMRNDAKLLEKQKRQQAKLAEREMKKSQKQIEKSNLTIQEQKEIELMQIEDFLSQQLQQESILEEEIEKQNVEILADISEMVEIFNSEEIADQQIGGTQKGKNRKANREAQQKIRQAQNKIKDKLLKTGKFQVVHLDSVALINVTSKPAQLKAFGFDLSYHGGDNSKPDMKISQEEYKLDPKLAQRQYKQKIEKCTKQLWTLINTIQKNYHEQVNKFGKTVKILITKGENKKLISEKINDKKDIEKLVEQILGELEFYEDFGNDFDSQETRFQVMLSQGLVGNVKNIGDNCKSVFKDALIISPNTQTRCFANALAILELVDKKVEVCLIYGQVKQLQDKISRQYKLVGTGGVCFEQLVEICKEKNIKMFKTGDKIDQNGIIISENHCLVALENNEQNLAYCQVLENNYFAARDSVMYFDKEKMIRKNPQDRLKLYITYDSEFTKDHIALQKQKVDGVKLEIKEIAYCISYHIFLDGEIELNNIAIVKKGIDCGKQFVECIYDIAQKHPNHDLIFYGHNSNKCDYPIFSKYLSKYFTKDQLDFSSRMSTCAYRWNLNEQIIQFQDTLNIFPASTLKQILKNYGDKNCQKLEVDHSLINIENWEQQWEDQKMEEYAKIDVLGLSKALINYNKLIKEKFGFYLLAHNNILSNSSLSQKAFLFNEYNPAEQPIYKLPKEYEEEVAEAYTGGSCQPFQIGHFKDIFGFSADINSAYSIAMCKLLPTGPYYKSYFNYTKYEGQELQFGVYNIYIKKCNENEKVVYYSQKGINGIQQPCYIRNKQIRKTSIEIEYMYKKGNTEIYLIDADLSKSCSKPLEKFVRALYQERTNQKNLKKECIKNGDKEGEKQHEAVQLLVKNTMNSLYGKFALRSERDESSFTTSQDVILDLCKNGVINNYEEKNINGLKIYEFDAIVQQQSNYSNLMIAAFITAYTRIYLNTMQEFLIELGFTLLYSDTDSVYFYCDKTWSSKKINEQMEKFAAIYCDQSELGKCKFETEDDIGASHLIWNKQNPDQEPLKYAFFDEGVVLCSKTYGLKSNLTNREFLKAKGIPAWIIENERLELDEQTQQKQRCIYNGNEKQFTFEDYINCSNGGSFSFDVVQTCVIKKNMYNEKELKQTQKVIKNVDCLYTQKKICDDGSLKYYKINGRADVSERQLEQKQENNVEGEYEIYQFIQEIKDEHKIDENDEDGEKYQKWLAKQIIVRRDKNDKSQFLLFKNHQAFVNYFNKSIKNSTEKNHHLITSKFNQAIQFDIDLKVEEIDDEYLKSEQAVQDMIKDIVKIFQLEGLQYELINRCRETKVSYHLRFAGKNWSFNMYRMLKSKIDDLKSTLKRNQEKNLRNLKNKKWVKLPETTLLDQIDDKVYKSQLRITSNDDKFLFNPSNFQITPKLSDDQVKRLQKYDTQFKTQMETIADRKIIESHKKVCEEWLRENKLQHIFSYRSSKNSGKKQIINLFHRKGITYNCEDCNKNHDNDHCTFLEIYFDVVNKKQTINMKCYKALSK